jgi:hypothetical protein
MSTDNGWIGNGRHGKVLHFFMATGEHQGTGQVIRSLCGLTQVVEGPWQMGGWPRWDGDCQTCIKIGLSRKDIRKLWDEGVL